MKKPNRLSKLSLSLMQGSLVCHPQSQQLPDIEQTKRVATQCLLLASKYVNQQKFIQAKDLLLVAMGGCLSVENPDQSTRKLAYLCCQEIAIINKESIKKKRKERRLDTYDRLIYQSSHRLIMMPFDKVYGQFIFSKQDRLMFDSSEQQTDTHREIKFEVSRLNSILFDFNNIESESSLVHTFGLYSLEFVISGLILVLLALGLFLSNSVFPSLSSLKLSVDMLEILTVVAPSCCFVLPLLMIYLKQANEKNPRIYQQRIFKQFRKLNSSNKSREYYLDNGSSLCIILKNGLPPQPGLAGGTHDYHHNS